MQDQTEKLSQEDARLVEFFKHFETMLAPKRSEITNWSDMTDFQVFSEFLVKDIREIQERLQDTNDEYLYYVCQHTFNIMDWIKLIVGAGLSNFGSAFEPLFDGKFKDKHILQNMYDACFEKWISQKNGQYKIGENFYNIIDGKLYYHNRFGQWFEVDRRTAFDLQPDKKLIKSTDLIEKLNSEYAETWYDTIIRHWEAKKYQGTLPEYFLRFDDKETSPEAYFNFIMENIKVLLKNPVSIAGIERWNGGKIVELEHIVKISALVLEIVKKRRKEDVHMVYLLRDCLMFYEIHKTLDFLDSEKTSSNQVLIGRKLLTHESREWGYYIATLESLYIAHKRYSTNFTDFYNEYARLLDMFVSLNSGFAKVVNNLADYIREHIQTEKNKIVIFDIGFQGSIALLTKYIIDCHIKPIGPAGKKIETDIKIGVGAEWSKELFGDRYENDYFPFLNRLQLMARSDELFHYKKGSLDSGKPRILMGDKEWQRKATIELAVFAMITLLEQTGNESRAGV
jgi:hypothetical protein